MLSSLQQSILATLAYFDMFEYPLTLLELQRYLFKISPEQNGVKYSLSEIESAWRGDEYLQRQIRFQAGWFYLRGRDELPARRAERYLLAVKKFKRARRTAAILARLPFVRQINVCNSLAFSNARAESDIDLFVVTAPGGVWWARGAALALLKLLRRRPEICLSFFVDEDNLDLSGLRMAPDDIYLAFWLVSLYPLYAAPGTQSLLPANAWLTDYLLQPTVPEAHPGPIRRTPARARIWLEYGLRIFSGLAGRAQLAVMPPAVKSRLFQNTDVVIKPGVLKFHTNDRRGQYWGEFNKRLLVIKTIAALD